MMYENFKRYSKRPIHKEKNKINICIFYKDRVPFDLRLVATFNILSQNSKYDFFIVFPEDYPMLKNDISDNMIYFDYIILQRDYFDFEIAEDLINKSKLLDFKIIYEIDDDLIHMDHSNPGYSYYNGIKNKLEYIISNVDIITVTTDFLKNQLYYLNENIYIIPNRLIDEWFNNISNSTIKPSKVVKIGYMGSIYHSWDLILIEESIKQVKDYFLKKDIEIIFELVGGTSDELDFANQIEVPNEYQNYFEFIEWFQKIVDWDIAIAPLEKSNINFSKSELKYLEYSALKIPGIYSNVGPYSNCIVHGENGVLIFNNSTVEWSKGIINLIKDSNLQIKIKENSYNDVINNFQIYLSVNEWINLFEKNKVNKYKKFFSSVLKRL